ncbi:hypothetical protein BB558_005322 [Smittium angustum]|uniref:Ribonuclease P/MRP protein subunit POP5 n=1 Tax=Smittium angustum TaxID=133377 RepID=A0A2U1J0S3_SMIAN|nr:hypothetical protein BB558_005322 [Smittium angustum]
MVRFKNRYISFKIDIENEYEIQSGSKESKKSVVNLSISDIDSTIRTFVNSNYGDAGMSLLIGNMTVKYFSPVTKLGILRVARDHYRMLWSSLTMISQIKSKRCRFSVLHISGTINKCQKAAISFDRELILKHFKEELRIKDSILIESNAKKTLESSKRDIESLEH